MPAISYKNRRRLALVVLLIGLPVYIVLAMNLAVWLGRPHFLLEFALYIALGVLWALPLRWLFLGVGQADPDADRGEDGGAGRD